MPLKRWSEKEISLIRELLDSNKSVAFIASHFNTSEQNIRMVMSRNRLKARLLSDTFPGYDSPKKVYVDLATRIRNLKGEINKLFHQEKFFSDDRIKCWLDGVQGFDLFCKEILQIEMQPYQLEMSEKMLNNKRCCFIMGRQCGKDLTISCFAIWFCIINSSKKVLIVSPAQRQSDLLFNRILNYLNLNKELYNSVDKCNMEFLRFRNGSEIHNLPSTSFIRGFTEVTNIFVNESCHGIEDETINAVLLPMLAIKDGSLVLMSSPSGCNGATWDAFNSPNYSKMQVPSSANMYIPKEWLDLQKQTMPAAVYDTEINANFSQSINNLFDIHLLDKISQNYDLRKTPLEDSSIIYYLGVDWGRIVDESVYVIISKNYDGIKRVENIIELNKVPFSAQVEHIKSLHKIYHFRKIIVEYHGLGMMPSETLKESFLPVEFFIPTANNKSEAYGYLLKNMENHRLVIPNSHHKLQYELRTFRYTITERGQTTLHHPSGGSDDIVDSLCFSVLASRDEPYPLLSNLSFRRETAQEIGKSSEILSLNCKGDIKLYNPKNKYSETWGQKLSRLQKTNSIVY